MTLAMTMGMDPIQKEAAARKMFAKLQARNRLRDMLEASRRAVIPQAERDLQVTRDYLRAWQEHVAAYGRKMAARGSHVTPSWASHQSPAIRTASEYLETSDPWAMDQVDRAVMEDLPKRAGGERMQAALLTRLYNDRVGAQVFRHARLRDVPADQIQRLADAAERELVGILKTRNLPFV